MDCSQQTTRPNFRTVYYYSITTLEIGMSKINLQYSNNAVIHEQRVSARTNDQRCLIGHQLFIIFDIPNGRVFTLFITLYIPPFYLSKYGAQTLLWFYMVLVLLNLQVSVKCFVDNCVTFCPLYFGHCSVCVSSINGDKQLLRYLWQLFLSMFFLIISEGIS